MHTFACSVLLLLLTVFLGLFRPGSALYRFPLQPRFRALDIGPASASGSLRNFKGVIFVGDVLTGTPGQLIPVLFDTGSSETWFPTPSFCKSTTCTSPGFQTSASKTYRESSAPFQVNYLSSSVNGVYGQDYVAFSQLSTNSAIDIGLVQDQTGFPEAHAFDGLVGMGPNSSFVQSTLDKAVANGKGERRMFSIYLSDSPDGGSMTMGGFDESHISGSANTSLNWFESYTTRNARALPYWILPSLSVAFGGKTVSAATAVVIDSGTSLIIGPQKAVAEIYRLAGNVDSSGSIECWRVLSLPTLSVTIGSKRYDLKPEQYAYRGNDKWTCHIGITPFSDESMWILGDVFMLNFLSVFSLEDPTTPADAVRPATLPKDDGDRIVRHWIGLANVSPPRNVEFPSPSWFNSLAFYRIIIITVVIGVLVVLGLVGRFMGGMILRAFRRLHGQQRRQQQQHNANVGYLAQQQNNAPFVAGSR